MSSPISLVTDARPSSDVHAPDGGSEGKGLAFLTFPIYYFITFFYLCQGRNASDDPFLGWKWSEPVPLDQVESIWQSLQAGRAWTFCSTAAFETIHVSEPAGNAPPPL
jgi:hypothetical protein